MPRYFFHVSGVSLFTDTLGAELANDAEAWSAAVVSCGELLQDIDGKMPDRAEVRVTVKDDTDRLVAVVRFTGERQSPVEEPPILAKEVPQRILAAMDTALDWIRDVHDPENYGPFASHLAVAALTSLEEGDRVGDGLVVRRETIQ
ncbi:MULTISPECIES: DUF6894 family protein [unclassified Aureimonas]|uniref:DUF6894 family protein n=1 Tax=unclassified Aureimonas TaxID=2615206 RepID=UPI0006FEDB47|nr:MULTISPECIES: hypothetical protein [unclassified Aureimonas]KQT52475.1 hypothetical protein ASG62_14740 [Aureimonas sp. Leaf427]KQT77624.1 hypothetical protein ASG54_11670 [Aureimonas sp. Leaf460]